MIFDFVIGCIYGVFVLLILQFLLDNHDDLDKPKLKDYYKMMAEREYYKTEYIKLRETLLMIDEEDVQLINKEHYNHFILKKEDNEKFWRDWLDDE